MIRKIIDWFLRKPKEIKTKIETKNYLKEAQERTELITDEPELSRILDHGLCPDCTEWEMYEGPSGGMSTNILCGNCGSEFNYCAGFVSQRIGQISMKGLNNSVDITPPIIREWHKVDLFHDRQNMKNSNNAREWCSDECSSNWTSNKYFFYFEDEVDATAFKLKWT